MSIGLFEVWTGLHRPESDPDFAEG